MLLSLSHRFKNMSLIMKSIKTAMTLRTRFPKMVAGFDLVTVSAQQGSSCEGPGSTCGNPLQRLGLLTTCSEFSADPF